MGSVLTLVGAHVGQGAQWELGPWMDERHTGSEVAGVQDRGDSRFNGPLQHSKWCFPDCGL